jgi:SAM-dependent methyltransferase
MDLTALAVNYNTKRPIVKAIENMLAEEFSCEVTSGVQKIRLLDIGCGAGQIAEYILGFSEKSEIIGVDITENMISQCQSIKQKYPERSVFMLADINDEYGRLQSFGLFDYLIFSQSIHFIKAPALDYLVRNCLKENGRVLLLATLPSDLKYIPYCTLSEKVLRYEQKRLLSLAAFRTFFRKRKLKLYLNKRIVLSSKLHDVKKYYLSRPFSALTILTDEEIIRAVDHQIQFLSNTEVLDIFNLMLYRKNSSTRKLLY